MLSLTYSCLILVPKDKSKINQNSQLIFGMAATGEDFKFWWDIGPNLFPFYDCGKAILNFL